MVSYSASISAYLSTLPEFASPACVASLYSGIARKKQSNPPLYQFIVSWWQRTLQDLAARGLQGDDKLLLHIDADLVESLRWKTSKPLGLGSAVVESTIPTSSGVMPKLIPLQRFWDTRESIYTPPSLISRALRYMVGKPLWWALEQLSLVDSEPDASEEEIWKCAQGDYVIISNLEKAAEAVIRKQSEDPNLALTPSVFSLDSFRKAFAGCALPETVLSDLDIRVLVLYLSWDRRAIVADKGVIKFTPPGQATTITLLDRGVLRMQTAVTRLEAQVAEIERQRAKQTEKAVACLRAMQKPLAMSHLRARKRLQGLLTRRLCTLETLQTYLATIKSAIGDTSAMAAYEESMRSLREALTQERMPHACFDATMDGLVSALAVQQEIEGAMELGEVSVNADEDALVAELAGLEDMLGEERKVTWAEELAERLEKQHVPTATDREGRIPADNSAGESLGDSCFLADV